MKIFLTVFGRDIRRRYKLLAAYALTTFVVMYALYSQIIFQESANARDPIAYMITPTYAVVIGAFSLIVLLTSRIFVGLYRADRRAEDGILMTLGIKRRRLSSMTAGLSAICFSASAVMALPPALLFIGLFVKYCTREDMSAAGFTPLAFAVPLGNLVIVTVIMFAACMLGTLSCLGVKAPIIEMVRGGSGSEAPENGAGSLKDNGTLADYGRLYVRRSVKRCLRYNAVAAFLLILPMIYLLGSSTFTQDDSTHDFTLHTKFDPTIGLYDLMTDEMISEISEAFDGAAIDTPFSNVRGGYTTLTVTLAEDSLRDEAYALLAEQAELYDLTIENTYANRTQHNQLNAAYRIFFMFMSLILFVAGGAISVSLLDSRLVTRKRELSLLRSLGVKLRDIHSAVLPETVIDHIGGSILSIIFGSLGFAVMMADGGGHADIKAVTAIACAFLVLNIFLNIHISKRLTIGMLSESDGISRKETV